MSNGNFLEDFVLGQKIIHAVPRTITEGDASLYISLTGDRRPLYCSQTFSSRFGYEKNPVNDVLVFNIAFGKTVHDISLNAIANLGYADVRFIAPVYVGDTVRCESTVIGIKENSDKKRGIVYVQSIALNQRNEEVMSWQRWVLLPKNDVSADIPDTLVPTLSKCVDLKNISVAHNIQGANFDSEATGSSRFWGDYEEGQTINHSLGLTIDDATHTMATQLYQNNAKVHFDAFSMAKTAFEKRLVYGGHIISLCHSLSFEGIENALNIVAINSGTHSNPSFAGDTIYAKSIILEKNLLRERSDLGLLRIRLIGIKNQEPASLKSIMNNESSTRYHENVVLDLDYSVTIPKGN